MCVGASLEEASALALANPDTRARSPDYRCQAPKFMISLKVDGLSLTWARCVSQSIT